MLRIIALLIGYVFGMIQTSYFMGLAKGFDIRKQGSGNAGTTNALRTMGKKAGAIVMVVDILKCMAAIGVVWLLFGRNHPEMDYLLRVYAGLGSMLGHMFPFFMGFKGGKGVACMAGLIMSLSKVMIIPGWALFIIVVALTHYVSLASLLVGAGFMIGTVIIGQTGGFHMSTPHLVEMYIIVFVVVALLYFGHRGNIARLLSGTERKTYINKKG